MRNTTDLSTPAPAFLFGRDGAMLRKIVDAAAVGMAVCAMDGAIVYCNAAFERAFGARARGFADLFDSVDTRFYSGLDAVKAGAQADYSGEHQCVLGTGERAWMSVSISVLHSEQTGDPLYLVIQLSNIDRQKKAERALAASESRWQFALDAARQGVWDYDARTGAMFYSTMWRRMRGYGPDEFVDDAQAAWLARVHPDDRERIRARVPRQNTGEDGFDILEYRERHKDGHYIWILSRGKPVEWDENGNALRTIGTDTDITHLKAIEARLAHAATHDSLTDLLNRRAFNIRLEPALKTGGHCLLFIDLDNFKPVNDMFGHAAGDRALVATADVIRETLAPKDCAARFGGDEFTVLLWDRPEAEAREVAQRIASAVARIEIGAQRDEGRIGASIGIARIGANDTMSAVYARADADCYRVKAASRGNKAQPGG